MGFAMSERGIEVGDQITSEDRSGVLAIYTIASVKKRGGIYTCTAARGTELRLRTAGDGVSSETYSRYHWFRRTVDGDAERLAARRNVERLKRMMLDADPIKWTPEQVSAVLAAWPKDVAK
jgi:hypothetical protein